MFWSCNNIYFDNLLVWYCNVTIFTYHINIEFIFDIFTIHSPFTKCDAWFQKEYNTHSFKYQNNFSCYVYFQHVLWFFFVILYFTRQNKIIVIIWVCIYVVFVFIYWSTRWKNACVVSKVAYTIFYFIHMLENTFRH